MLRKFRNRMESEKGFTLIELLVVILIIGILAAIALPAFLSQRSKGQDADAKSNARNLVSQLESCYSQDQAYTNCLLSEDVTTSGLPIGGGVEQVTFTSVNANSYVVTAKSKSTNEFRISKVGGASPTRSCDVDGKGACPSDGTW